MQTYGYPTPPFAPAGNRFLTAVKLLLLVQVIAAFAAGAAFAQTVRNDRPRVMMTPAMQADLVARRTAADPTWVALKQRADELATYPVIRKRRQDACNGPRTTDNQP